MASDDRSSGPVAAGGTSAYVSLPPGTRGLLITGDEGVPGSPGTELVLYRLSPLALAPTSVTTVFVRGTVAAEAGAADIVTLPTRVTSADPGQALVRVVDAKGPAPSGTVHRLVPLDGANPGSAEVALDSVAFERAPPSADSVAPAYVPVPVGQYRLARPDGTMVEATLSFAGGDVRTLVLSGADAPPIVVNDNTP